MADLSKNQVIQIINNRPAGTTPEGVVAALRREGHNLEGYPIETPAGIKVPPRKTELSTAGRFFEGLSGVLGGAKEILQIPQTITTAGLKATGEVLGGRPPGEALREAGREISRIPTEVARGFGAGVLAPTRQLEPSRVFGEAGIEQLAPGTVGGLFVDIAGDPTLVTNLLINKGARRELLEQSKRAKPFLQSFGESLSDFIKQPRAEFKREFAQIGKEFAKEAPEEVGRKLAGFNIKGSLEEMIGQINRRVPRLRKTLDRLAEESTDVVKIQPVADKLETLGKRFDKVGKAKTAQQIREGVNILRENARVDKLNDLIPIDEALTIKRALDTARQTARGALSESKKVTENLIFKTVGDELRDQINKVPKLGPINEEITTLLEGLGAVADVASKRISEGGILPVKFTGRFFPFVRVKPGTLAKVRTEVGGAVMQLSKIIGTSPKDIEEALRIVLPTAIQNLFD